ncbi:MAG: ribose-phosphate diphosphokinase [Candidatus Woesearchaeota archaeon]
MIFATRSAQHLLRGAKAEVKKFADGEIYVKIKENVRGKEVYLLASLNSAENFFEFLLFLDALKRNGAKVVPIILYLNYARQDRAQKGEAFSAKVIADIINNSFKRKIIIDIHSRRALKLLRNVKNVVPLEIFLPKLKKIKNSIVVAPDNGAIERAKAFAKKLRTKIAVIEKRRTNGRIKILGIKGKVAEKNVIIVDDMIATGETAVLGAKLLKQKGANDIYAVATHPVLCRNAQKLLAQSLFKKVFVSNSIKVSKKTDKIEVISLYSLISRLAK